MSQSIHSYPGDRLLSIAGFGLALLMATPAAAAVVVPDDLPTVQAALDSGADTVLVRPGDHPETPIVDREVVVRALLSGDPNDRPRLGGLILDDTHQGSSHSARVRIEDLRFTGPVRNVFHVGGYSGPLTIFLERCVMDSGITDDGQTALGQLEWSIRSCTIDGGVRVKKPESLSLVGNTIRGAVAVSNWDTGMWVVGNRIEGGGDVGLDVYSDETILVLGNTVRGFRTGIRVAGSECRIRDNRVEDCEYNGVFVEVREEDVIISHNQVSRCGNGIFSQYHSRADVDSNAIEDCGNAITLAGVQNKALRNTVRRCSIGIRAVDGEFTSFNENVVENCDREAISAIGSFSGIVGNRVERCGGGIFANAVAVSAERNRVIGSGEDGIRVEGLFVTIAANVVGRSGRDGISIFSGHADVRAIGNTIYSNRRIGLYVRYTDSYEQKGVLPRIRSNVSAFNGEQGLAIEVGGVPDTIDQGCNDWYGNSLPNVVPWIDPDDFSFDPLFCDTAGNDVRVRADSPLLGAACGPIGALGQGCDATTPALVSRFDAERDAGVVRVRWRLSNADAAPPAWVERSGSSDGPWIPIAGERASEGEVIVETDRAAAPDRDSWYRLVALEKGNAEVVAGPIRVAAAAQAFSLGRIAPNPAAGPVRIEFTVGRRGAIDIAILDVMGRDVASVASGEWPAGRHVVEHRAGSLPAGLYWIRYRHFGGTETRRLAIAR